MMGIAAFVVGAILLWAPAKTKAETYQLLIALLGLYWLIGGIADIISMFVDHTSWGWKLFMGIVSIIAGGYILMYPIAAGVVIPKVFVLVLGLWTLIEGVILLVMAFRGGGWGAGILGVVSIISRARGDARADSDYDLLLVEPSELPRHKRAVRYRRALTGVAGAKDIPVRTPDEVAQWRDVPNAFVTTAVQEGVVLYDRSQITSLESWLRHALQHLYDPTELAGNPLAGLLVGTGPGAALALRRLLIEAIEALKPDPAVSPESDAVRTYQALSYRFVKQFSQSSVALTLNLSVRQMRRQEGLALQELATYHRRALYRPVAAFRRQASRTHISTRAIW